MGAKSREVVFSETGFCPLAVRTTLRSGNFPRLEQHRSLSLDSLRVHTRLLQEHAQIAKALIALDGCSERAVRGNHHVGRENADLAGTRQFVFAG